VPVTAVGPSAAPKPAVLPPSAASSKPFAPLISLPSTTLVATLHSPHTGWEVEAVRPISRHRRFRRTETVPRRGLPSTSRRRQYGASLGPIHALLSPVVSRVPAASGPSIDQTVFAPLLSPGAALPLPGSVCYKCRDQP